MTFRIKWAQIYRLYETIEPLLKISLPLENPPAGKRFLVIAPHIDDETIGCGGTIHKHARSGNRVTVLFVADCTPERIREGEAAGTVLGISEKIYWEYKSKTLDRFPEIGNRLTELIRKTEPDVLYVPSMIDRHNDHIALNFHVRQALANLKHNFMIYCYEVWTTLVPNVVVDISGEIQAKREALQCYKSQLESHDWVEGILSLNRYRGMIANAKSHGEAFFRMSPVAYLELWKRLYGRSS